jgi:hypothetical protein
MRTIFESFVVAEAIVGIALTLAIACGENDSSSLSAPLFSIGAILILYAFISGSWVRVPGRLDAPGMVENTERAIEAEQARPPRRVRLSRIADHHRISMQWALSGVLLLANGCLLLVAW